MDYIFLVLVILTGFNALCGVVTFIELFSKKEHPYDKAFFDVGDYVVLTQMVLLMASCFYFGHFITKVGLENISVLNFDFIASVVGIAGNILNFIRIDTAYSWHQKDRDFEEYLKKQKEEIPQ